MSDTQTAASTTSTGSTPTRQGQPIVKPEVPTRQSEPIVKSDGQPIVKP